MQCALCFLIGVHYCTHIIALTVSEDSMCAAMHFFFTFNCVQCILDSASACFPKLNCEPKYDHPQICSMCDSVFAFMPGQRWVGNHSIL